MSVGVRVNMVETGKELIPGSDSVFFLVSLKQVISIPYASLSLPLSLLQCFETW